MYRPTSSWDKLAQVVRNPSMAMGLQGPKVWSVPSYRFSR